MISNQLVLIDKALADDFIASKLWQTDKWTWTILKMGLYDDENDSFLYFSAIVVKN
jgi:hypothetical protein